MPIGNSTMSNRISNKRRDLTTQEKIMIVEDCLGETKHAAYIDGLLFQSMLDNFFDPFTGWVVNPDLNTQFPEILELKYKFIHGSLNVDLHLLCLREYLLTTIE